MEVIAPRVPSPDFNFESTCSSPYAPSSPKRFGNHYFSAPSSPNRISSFYRELNEFNFNGGSSRRGGSVIPYDWEETPGTPKATNLQSKEEEEEQGEQEEEESVDFAFEFEFSGQLDIAKASLPADELFDGGKIKPLKPPPRFETSFHKSPNSSPRSPIKKMIREAFSPKSRKEVDPFAVAIEQSRRGGPEQEQLQRGRERVYSSISSSKSRKGSRSLSPFRTPPSSENQQQHNVKTTSSNSKSSSRKMEL